MVEDLKNGLSEIKPFTIKFRSFRSFSHGTVFLHPEVDGGQSPLIQLQLALEKTFPFCDDLGKKSKEGFQPHLTVGQWPKNDLKRSAENLQNDWKSIDFDVKEVYMITRDGFDDPFRIVYRIPFNGEPEKVSQVKEAPVRQSRANPSKVFVGNLAFKTDEQALTQFFSSFGLQPTSIVLVKNPSSNGHKGFGFVEFLDEKAASLAVTIGNGRELDGRQLKIQNSK